MVIEPPFRPVAVVGHRGSGRGVSPAGLRENTFESMVSAVESGADWVEADGLLTADGHLVLSHEVHGPGGVPWAGLTLDEALSVGAEDARVLDRLPAHVGVDLEVKASFGDLGGSSAAPAAARFVGARKDARPWLMSSFDPTVAAVARQAGVPFGMLSFGGMYLHEAVVIAARLGAQVAIVHDGSVWQVPCGPSVQECLVHAAQAGVQVAVWDASPRSLLLIVSEPGFAAVCVDDVPATRAALTRAAPSGPQVPAQDRPVRPLRVPPGPVVSGA